MILCGTGIPAKRIAQTLDPAISTRYIWSQVNLRFHVLTRFNINKLECRLRRRVLLSVITRKSSVAGDGDHGPRGSRGDRVELDVQLSNSRLKPPSSTKLVHRPSTLEKILYSRLQDLFSSNFKAIFGSGKCNKINSIDDSILITNRFQGKCVSKVNICNKACK